LDGGEIKEIEESTKKGGEDFGGRIEGDMGRVFEEGDFFEESREFLRGGKKMVLDEEINTKRAKEESEEGPKIAEEVGGNYKRGEKEKELARKVSGVSHATKETERLILLPDREKRSF